MLNKTTNLFMMLAAFVLALGLTIPGGIEVYAHHKEGHGGGGDDTDTNNALVRAAFRQEHTVDGSSTAIQSDILGNLLVDQCDVDDEGAYDYWDPDDTVCNPPEIPPESKLPQIGFNIINHINHNWDMWIPPADKAAENANAPESEDVVIKRWTAFDFTDLIGVNANYRGEIQDVPVDGCLDLDKLLYDDDKYRDPPGEGKVFFDPDTGGLDLSPCRDNLVIRLRTDFTISLFDLPDEALVDVELNIMAPGDPPVKNGAEEGNRWWEPRFRLDHGQLQKEKDPTKPDVIVLRSIPQPCADPPCQHLADLIDLIANGPLSKRIVATYDMPVEIEIKRIIP